jgi:ribonucleotide reductase alpha subunit
MSAHPPHAAAPADVLPDDLPAADLSDNARIVLARRYLKKDDKGRPVEEPEQMFWRVARVIAEEDRKYGASEGAKCRQQCRPRSAAVRRAAAVYCARSRRDGF